MISLLSAHGHSRLFLTSRDMLEIKDFLEIGLQLRQDCTAHPEYYLAMRFITGSKQLKLINRDVFLGVSR